MLCPISSSVCSCFFPIIHRTLTYTTGCLFISFFCSNIYLLLLFPSRYVFLCWPRHQMLPGGIAFTPLPPLFTPILIPHRSWVISPWISFSSLNLRLNIHGHAFTEVIVCLRSNLSLLWRTTVCAFRLTYYNSFFYCLSLAYTVAICHVSVIQ